MTDKLDKTGDQLVEETVEEIVEETVEETAEETVEVTADEADEKTAEEAEETVKESAEEAVEESAGDPVVEDQADESDAGEQEEPNGKGMLSWDDIHSEDKKETEAEETETMSAGDEIASMNEDDFDEGDLGDGDEFEEDETPVPGGFYMETEDPEEEEVAKKKRKKKKNHSVAKTLGKILLGLLIFVAVAYLGITAFFWKHFFYDTKINGSDFSLRSEADVQKYMTKQVDNYALTIQEVDGSEEKIVGSDIGIQYKKSAQIAKELEKQNPFLWSRAFWKPDDLKVDIGVDYDEAKLVDVISKLNCMNQENWTAPTSAQPEYNGEEFVVKKEVFGTTLVPEKFNEVVRNNIAGFVPTVNLEEAECYLKPKFVSTSPEVQAACDKMNAYSKASITYKFGDNTEVVDRNVIKDWLSVNIDDMSVTYNEDAVNGYVAQLAEKYDTLNKTRSFLAQNGQTYQVRPGTYGWSIAQETEVEALKAHIQNGETIEKEPAYATTARTHTDQDWGDTYAEVSISQQHMWYIKGGQVVFQADVVTGLPTAKRATPTGMHQCLEKAENKVLRGDRLPGGGYEYETPVRYWMRVTWSGVGFHTATWQPWFGGNRYTYAGSHGCINMSYSDSQALYGIIQVGDAVIIHE